MGKMKELDIERMNKEKEKEEEIIKALTGEEIENIPDGITTKNDDIKIIKIKGIKCGK